MKSSAPSGSRVASPFRSRTFSLPTNTLTCGRSSPRSFWMRSRSPACRTKSAARAAPTSGPASKVTRDRPPACGARTPGRWTTTAISAPTRGPAQPHAPHRTGPARSHLASQHRCLHAHDRREAVHEALPARTLVPRAVDAAAPCTEIDAGGIAAVGGEPIAQHRLVRALLRKAAGVVQQHNCPAAVGRDLLDAALKLRLGLARHRHGGTQVGALVDD